MTRNQFLKEAKKLGNFHSFTYFEMQHEEIGMTYHFAIASDHDADGWSEKRHWVVIYKYQHMAYPLVGYVNLTLNEAYKQVAEMMCGIEAK